MQHKFIGTQIIGRQICHVETHNYQQPEYFEEFEKAARSESRTADISGKVSETQKNLIQKAAKERNVTPSTMICMMAEFWFAFHPYQEEMVKDVKRIRTIVENVL